MGHTTALPMPALRIDARNAPTVPSSAGSSPLFPTSFASALSASASSKACVWKSIFMAGGIYQKAAAPESRKLDCTRLQSASRYTSPNSVESPLFGNSTGIRNRSLTSFASRSLGSCSPWTRMSFFGRAS